MSEPRFRLSIKEAGAIIGLVAATPDVPGLTEDEVITLLRRLAAHHEVLHEAADTPIIK